MRVLIAIVASAELFAIIMCARKMRPWWSRYKDGRQEPLLRKESIAVLGNLRPEWPLNDRRWPPPVETMSGVDNLSSVAAAAYARLARRASRRANIAAEVFLVAGGAWLSIRLDSIWSDIQLLGSDDPSSSFSAGAHFLRDIVPLFVIEVGVLLRAYVHKYSDASEVYRQFAIDSSKIGEFSPHHARGGFWGGLFRRLA